MTNNTIPNPLLAQPESTTAPAPVPAPMGSAGTTGRPTRRRRFRRRVRAADIFVWVTVAFTLFVFVWIFGNSLRGHQEIFANPWGFPTAPRFDNWVNAWTISGFGEAIVNSVFVTAGSSVAIVAVAAPAAYILAKTNRAISEMTFLYFGLGLGIPIQVIIIPLFVVMQNLGLLNSLAGLVLVYVALNLPFNVFLLAGFFRTVPDSLEEAASLDGAGTVRTFFSIVLPMASSGIRTAFILCLVGIWSEVFVAIVLIQSPDLETLPLKLLRFMSQQQYSGNDYGQLLAGVGIILLPVLIAYVWFGRRIIEGMTLGADK